MAIRPYGPGKFETILDSYVYQVSLDGCDEQEGDVQESGWWYGLLSGEGLAAAVEHEAASHSDPLNTAELELLHSAAGAIISENNQGFVYVEYFTDAGALAAAWAKVVAEQAEYYDDASDDSGDE